VGGECCTLDFFTYVFLHHRDTPIHFDLASQDSAGGGGASATDFVSCVGKWRQAGASVVGGCCRTSPATVSAIARALRDAGVTADVDEYDDFPAVAVL
jgi:hypothetical protein